MHLRVLASGSKANVLLLRSGATRILIDAGLGIRKLTAAFEEIGDSPDCLSAIFLTHEHADHARALSRLLRRHPIPVFASPGTLERLRPKLPERAQASAMTEGFVEVEPFRVHSIPISHDAADPVAYVIASGDHRVVVATDLGEVPDALSRALSDSTCAVIESNHDEDLLESGPYPRILKDRIRSSSGHLSNRQTADALAACGRNGLQHVVLAHISAENNDPELALNSARRALEGRDVQIHLTAQGVPGPYLDLSLTQTYSNHER